MIIKSLHVSNFQSLGEIIFTFPSGLTLIDGFNLDTNSSLGSGKSAMINSLVFSIYGQVPKNVTLNDLIRDGQDKLQTYVQLEIDGKNVEITRTRTTKTTKIQLKVNGEIIDGLAKDIENKILGITGLTFDQFIQIVYVFQNSENRFISLNDTEKKSFLSTLFNLEMYDEAYKKAHNDLNAVEIRLSGIDGALKSSLGEQGRLLSQKKELESKQEILLLEQNKQQSVLLEQIGVLKPQLEDLNQQKVASENRSDVKDLESRKTILSYAITEIGEYKKHADRIKRDMLRTDYEISGINNTIQELDGSVDCPTCKRSWPPEYKDNIKSTVDSYKAQRSNLIGNNAQNKQQLTELDQKLSKEAELRSRYETLSNEIARLNSAGINSILLQIRLKKTELKSLIDKYESFDTQKKIGLENIQRAETYLAEVDKSIADNNAQLIELTEKKRYLLEIKKIFSPTGIKAYIFNGIIAQLNQSIDQHLNRLTNGEIYFKIVLDEQKGKYIDTLECQGKPRSVASLSGGEHRKLSLAVDLALSDVICSRVNYVPNILFLDEAFNGLDASSKEIIMEVLTEMSKNKNIFVIDHSSEFKSQFTQVVKLIKQGGITMREEHENSI